MSKTTPLDDEGFTALHSRCRLADDGTPALIERLVRHLDLRHADRERAPVPGRGLTLDEGLTRLGDEYPALAACVERCGVGPGRMTTRDAAAALGISPATVCNRRRAGVAQLVVWTGLGEETVVAALGYGDKPLTLRKQAG